MMTRENLEQRLEMIQSQSHEVAINFMYYTELAQQLKNTKLLKDKNALLWEMVQVLLFCVELQQSSLDSAAYVVQYYEDFEFPF